MIIRFLSLHGYYLFLVVGVTAMQVLILVRRKRYSLSILQAFIFNLLLSVTGIAGTKVLHFFESGMKSYSGMSFFGALFLELLLMPLFGLAFKLKPADTLDACAPCGAAMVAFQRFGCYCAGCCGGIPIGNSNKVWPTQLMEGFGDIAILCFLLTAEKRESNRGRGYPLFLASYGIIRFVIEFARDTPKDWMGLSHGQWFSIAGIGIALLMILGDMIWKKQRKENSLPAQD